MLQYVISLSVLIAAVILIRAIFRKKVPPIVVYAMWLAVVIRMCIPVSLIKMDIPDFSLPLIGESANEEESNRPAADETESYYVRDPWEHDSTGTADDQSGTSEKTDGETMSPYIPPVYDDGEKETNGSVTPPIGGIGGASGNPSGDGIITNPPVEEVEPIPDTNEQGISEALKADAQKLLGTVWVVGSIVAAAVTLISALVFHIRVKRDRVLLRVIKNTKVYVSENVGGPCLWGLIPSIYLTPENAYSDACALTLLHEYTHLRHGDNIWSLIRQAALIVHWWNPLVWAAVILSKHDAELACDASVTKTLDAEKRLEYARIIVDTVPQVRGHAVGLASGGIKERILMITGSQKNRVIAIVLAVLICISAGACAFIGLNNDGEYSEGFYLRCDNGASVIVLDIGPCVMSVQDEGIFADLTDGDRIRVEHGGIAESYPMQTMVYSIEKIADGEREDIPEELLGHLYDLEYLKKDEVPTDDKWAYFAEAYAEAERIYAMFTGYGKVEYGGETVEQGGVQYRRVTTEGFTTYTEMEETVRSCFADSLADALLGAMVGDNALYIEHEGALYRLGGYAALWGYDAAMEPGFEKLPSENGEQLVRVTATATEDGLKCTASEAVAYKVDSNGAIKFTKFTLMADSLFALYQRDEGVRVYVTVTFPESEVGWFKVAQYGYNFYTSPNNGGHSISAGNTDAVGYVVFGTKNTRFDEGYSEYITYRVEAKNGGIVSCEQVDNIIDLDFEALGTPLGELPDGVYSAKTSYAGYVSGYSILIEGERIKIYSYPDGSEGSGQYYGTYTYDGTNGKLTADLMYDQYYTNDPDTEWGTLEATLYKYGDFVAVICDRGFAGTPMKLPLIYMKHEAIYGTERGVYFTSYPESFSPPESQARNALVEVGEFSYLISYYTNESLPCVYYGNGADAERYAMVKTEFEKPDFEYTSWESGGITTWVDRNVVEIFVKFTKPTGEIVTATYELDLDIDTAEPNEQSGYDTPVWRIVVPEEVDVYYTPTPTKYFPPRVIRRNENITLDETSYLITYMDSEILPCIYYAFKADAENFAMIKTVFEDPGFDYKSCSYSGVTVYDDSSAAEMYLTYAKTDGGVLKLKYKLTFDENLTLPNILGSYNAPVWQIDGEVELMEEIYDIADWDSLPWISGAGDDEIHATPIYELIHCLVSGESAITEFNGLGIKDYTIKIVEDSGHGPSTVNFTFTVTGDSLPESIPQGEHSWEIYVFSDNEDPYVFEYPSVYIGEKPETEDEITEYDRTIKALDKFGDNAAVQTVDAWLTYRGHTWSIPDFGEWGENSYVPVNYILRRYGDDRIEYDKLVQLMAEKFGITDPEAMGLYEGEWDINVLEFQEAQLASGGIYDRESGIVTNCALGSGRKPVYRFLDVREADGVTYVTVQLYADFNRLIPSHKVEYAIGEGDVFLGSRVVEESIHAPNAVSNYKTYTTPVSESATAYNTADPTTFYPPESSSRLGQYQKIGDNYVRAYSVQDELCVYRAVELDDGTFDMVKTEFEEPNFEYDYPIFRGYFDMGDGETAGAVVWHYLKDGSYTEVLYTLDLTADITHPSVQGAYITPMWKVTEDTDFDAEAYAELIPNERARVESWARLAKSGVYLYACSVRDARGNLTKDFAVYYTNQALDNTIGYIELALPAELEYDSVLPVLVDVSESSMSCAIYLKLTKGDEWYYVKFANGDGAKTGKFLEFKYDGVLADDNVQDMWRNYPELFELASQRITITDIADWDTLPWRQEIREGSHPAGSAYNFVYNLVSGKSTVAAYNELGIKDYSLRLLYDRSGDERLEFKFTVTGNSLSETLSPGNYTWVLFDGMYLNVYNGMEPNTMEGYDAYEAKTERLDEFSEYSAVRAVNDWLRWTVDGEFIADFGDWSEKPYLPVGYLVLKYGEYRTQSMPYEELLELLSEKFGISADEDLKLYEDGEFDDNLQVALRYSRCEYDKETKTVKFADTRGYREIHRFLDVRIDGGVTYVTVQHFADANYLIPTYKVEYAIGGGDVFLGCRVVEFGEYVPEFTTLSDWYKMKIDDNSKTADGLYTRFTLADEQGETEFGGRLLVGAEPVIYAADITKDSYSDYAVVLANGKHTEEVHILERYGTAYGWELVECEAEDPLDFIEERVRFTSDGNGCIINMDGVEYRMAGANPEVGEYVKYSVNAAGRLVAHVGCEISDGEVGGVIEIEYYFSTATNTLRAGIARFVSGSDFFD